MFNKVTAHPKKSRTSKTCHVVLVPLVQSRSQVAPDTKTSREKAGAARSMPAHSDDGLTEKSIDVLFRAALEVVADNFNAAEHLPKPVYDFLLPVATSSCQGLYATAMLFLGSMPALANGASVRLWTQKPSPLALMVLHMAPAQRGKSRLYQAVELLFEAADDVLEDLAKVDRRAAAGRCSCANQEYLPAKLHDDWILLQMQRRISSGRASPGGYQEGEGSQASLVRSGLQPGWGVWILGELVFVGFQIREGKGLLSQRPRKHTQHLAGQRQNKKSHPNIYILWGFTDAAC